MAQERAVAPRVNQNGVAESRAPAQPSIATPSPLAASPHQLAHIPATGVAVLQAAKKRSNAERLRRAQRRGEKRKARDAVGKGRYMAPGGPITISGGPGGRQRIVQGNKQDYDQETFGAMPAYADIKKELPDSALPELLARTRATGPQRRRLATGLAIGLSHVAEEHRSPGSGKFIRALIRRKIREPKAPHPFDAVVNPGVGANGPQKLRDLVSGTTPLNPDQDAAMGYASESSDDDDDNYALRKGLLRPQKPPGK